MNTDITILIVCGNCTMRTKYPSESIDMYVCVCLLAYVRLNRWYPVEKVYLDGVGVNEIANT